MTPQAQDQIRELVRRNKVVLSRADAQIERIEQTLKRSHEVSERALPVLKRAGLIR